MVCMETTITRIPTGHPAGTGGQFAGMRRPDPLFRLVTPLSDIGALRLKHALRNAVNGNGDPLSPNARELITAVVANPTSATWENAYSIIISVDRPGTVWGNTLAHTDYDVDRGPAAIGNVKLPWKEIPTREQILIGLELGTKGKK